VDDWLELTGTNLTSDSGEGFHSRLLGVRDPEEGCYQCQSLRALFTNVDGLPSSQLHEFMPGRVVEFQFDITDQSDHHLTGSRRFTLSCGPNDECIPQRVQDLADTGSR